MLGLIWNQLFDTSTDGNPERNFEKDKKGQNTMKNYLVCKRVNVISAHFIISILLAVKNLLFVTYVEIVSCNICLRFYIKSYSF